MHGNIDVFVHTHTSMFPIHTHECYSERVPRMLVEDAGHMLGVLGMRSECSEYRILADTSDRVYQCFY